MKKATRRKYRRGCSKLETFRENETRSGFNFSEQAIVPDHQRERDGRDFYAILHLQGKQQDSRMRMEIKFGLALMIEIGSRRLSLDVLDALSLLIQTSVGQSKSLSFSLTLGFDF